MRQKNKLIILSLILFIAIFNKQYSQAADYESELISNPQQTSIIENTKAEKKIIRIKKKRKQEATPQETYNSTEVIIDSDFMNYYPEKFEIEAIGNAKVTLKSQNMTIYGDRIVFNHDLNNLKAYDNVKIINPQAITDGDFVNLDLNKQNGWIDHPITNNYSIKIDAKEGNYYSDRIEEYDGVAKVLKNNTLVFGATSMSAWVNPGRLSLDAKKREEPTAKGVYRIKAKTIYIDSKDNHNVITMKPAVLYMHNTKIGTIPNLEIVSDKNTQYVETNVPEFGSISELGMYAGPGIVLPAKGSSVLKLVPMINYNDSNLGVGALARYRSKNSLIDFGYGSSANKVILRGTQRLTDNLRLDYSQNMYQDEWFLGFRRPRYSAQLVYAKDYHLDDIDANFSQRFSGGYFVDKDRQFNDMEGRYRWMTQTQKTFYAYSNADRDLNIKLGLVGQTSLSLYTTGDTVSIVRFGPMISSQYKNWTQSLIYFQTAAAGQSPFEFDKYAYGSSNIVFIENLKLHKFISVGYLGSLALNKDNSEDNLFQENRFLLSLGPDYAKVTFGYDAFRQNTMMLVSMLVGSEGSDVKFDKAVIKNPDNLSKNKNQPEKRPLIDLSKIFPTLAKDYKQ